MWRWLLILLLVHLSAVGARSYAPNQMITIYGSLRPEVIVSNPEGRDAVRRMDDGYSRVGVKGRADLGETLWGYYKYERRVSANDGEDDGAVRPDNNELREVHVGIGGSFGSLAIGRHYGQYYDVIDDEIDRHRSHYSDAAVFGDLFVSNGLLYRTPEIGPLSGGVLVELNDADAKGASIDERVELTLSLAVRGAALHLGYVSSPVHDGMLGLAGSYGFDRWTVAAVHQRLKGSSSPHDKIWSGAVDLDVRAGNRLRFAVTKTLAKGDRDLDETLMIGGGDHRFSDHFMLWVEIVRSSTRLVQSEDESALVAGMRFDL